MSYVRLEEANFGQGVIKDISSWLLPPGSLADASNIIFDEPGVARQRNGSTALSSPATTAFSTSLGFVYAADQTPIEELYGVNNKGAAIFLVNKTTGATTTISAAGGTNITTGRPVRHFGWVFFPFSVPVNTNRSAYQMAGQTTTTTFVNAATATITALNPQITLTGADVTTNIKVGQCIVAQNATNMYRGRVVSIDTTKLFTVSPTPPISFTVSIGLLIGGPFDSGAGGSCGASFQNRLCFGNTQDLSTAAPSPITDRRVIYSPLPTETSLFSAGASTLSGATWTYGNGWPLLNYFEVPGSDPIVAMEPVSDNEMLILTTQGIVIFRGTLATQTTSSAPGVTFDISPLNSNAGCLSDLSVVRTPHGIIWASAEGIMLYTGGGRSPIDLTAGKIHTTWRNLTRGSSFAVHGAFYARNHYVVSGISGGTTFSWCFNLDNQTWAFLSGAGTDTFNGAARPTDPTQVFAGRWWDISGAAPTQTGGHVVRVESLFAPDVVGQTKTDADGSVVALSLKSRTLTGDQEIERILRRMTVRYEAEMAATNIAAAVGARLDSAETAGTPTTSVGSLSNTSTLSISGQSNASPIVITTSANHGLQDEDWVDIHGCTPNTAANGRWKIDVLSNTTFSLNQSTGNAATSATGTAKKVTEQELVCSATDIGQGHWLNLSSSGTVNRFKFHGLRLAALMMDRGMSGAKGG